MSQATLSPSPITFRGPAPSSFASISRYNPSAPASNDLFFERRRTSHPHNPPIHPFQAAAENMPQRSQSQQRPRLEHRTSQTLIDLTEDAEEVIPAVARNRAPSQRPQPPQLGRSDAQGLADVIDLTEDDVEIQITGARNRELPLPRPDVTRPRPYAHPPRHESPDLFVPANQPPPLRNANFPAAGAFGVAVVGGPSRHALHFHHILHGGDGGAGDVLAQIIGHAQGQAMPQMDYRHAAFADRKPDHIPPEPAKPGFTRSPTESDTIICPSCEEELVHDKEFDEPMLKKGKVPTRKEREEHPFWVIKECGHVSSHPNFTSTLLLM